MFDRFTERFSLCWFDDIITRSFYILTSLMLSFFSMFAVLFESCSSAHDELSFVKKLKTAAMVSKSLFHQEKLLMSKTEGPENGCCDAHTEANFEMPLVSITEDFIGHWSGCDIRKDGAANHFDSMSVGFNPLVPWSAGFRWVGIWCQVLFPWVSCISARRIDTKLFCFFSS